MSPELCPFICILSMIFEFSVRRVIYLQKISGKSDLGLHSR